MQIKGSIKLSPLLENLINNHRHLAGDGIEKGMEYIGQGVTERVRETIITQGLVQSGKLAKSLAYDVKQGTGKLKTVVGSNVFYAHILEGGANLKSFKVKPKKKKALSWPGATHPIRGEIQSGGGRIRAYNFMGGTVSEMEQVGAIEDLFGKGVKEAIDDLIMRGF